MGSYVLLLRMESPHMLYSMYGAENPMAWEEEWLCSPASSSGTAASPMEGHQGLAEPQKGKGGMIPDHRSEMNGANILQTYSSSCSHPKRHKHGYGTIPPCLDRTCEYLHNETKVRQNGGSFPSYCWVGQRIFWWMTESRHDPPRPNI